MLWLCQGSLAPECTNLNLITCGHTGIFKNKSVKNFSSYTFYLFSFFDCKTFRTLVPDQGSNLHLLHWKCGDLITESPGKSCHTGILCCQLLLEMSKKIQPSCCIHGSICGKGMFILNQATFINKCFLNCFIGTCLIPCNFLNELVIKWINEMVSIEMPFIQSRSLQFINLFSHE